MNSHFSFSRSPASGFPHLPQGQRESEFRDLWLPRSERILDTIVATGSSIVCLQECWLSHPEWVRLFDSSLGAAGYRTLKLPRTNNRGDGLMIAVKSDQWHVVDYQQLLFHDCGDRVAQIVRLRSKGRLGGRAGREGSDGAEGEEEDVLVVNTHLLFPHDANSNIIRLCQVYKLLERVEQCRIEQAGRPAPVILCGDLNGTKEGNVYKLLRSQGFLSSYDTVHHLNDVDETWVSHRSHRGDVCGVDYVWMLNARTPMSHPILNWRKAVFGLIKSKLLAAGITDARHAFQFFATAGDTSPFEHTVCFTSDPNATDAADVSMDFGQQQNDDPAAEEQEQGVEEEEEEDEEAWRYYDSDEEGMERQECCITAFTIEDFQLAVAQLGLTGDNSIGLTEVEVAELMQGADTDGDGWVDFNEFQDMFQQPTWDSRVDTLKQSMAASLADSLAAASAAAAAPGSAASASAPAAAAGAAAVSAGAAPSAASPSAASSQEQQKQRRWEEKEQAVLQGGQPYWESRRGLNVEGEAGQGNNRCRDGSGAADAGGAAVGGAVGASVDAAGADAAKEVTGGAAKLMLFDGKEFQLPWSRNSRNSDSSSSGSNNSNSSSGSTFNNRNSSIISSNSNNSNGSSSNNIFKIISDSLLPDRPTHTSMAGAAGGGAGGRGGSARGGSALAQELLLYVCSAGISALVLLFTFRQLDPNRAQAKLAKQRKREIAKRLGRPYIETNMYEDVIANDVINPQDIHVTFDSIGGLQHVKESLHDLVILPLQRPELFAQGRLLRPQKGVLLFGPPGTGKTLLAKAIAKECRAVFINVRIANLMSKWFGDAQKLVTAVFTLAHKLQPAIIFIDEVESFLGQRRNTEHEAVTSMKTEFMSLWDGFSTDDTARVMVLAATNRPWELDEAILRRLPRHFEIPLPDLAGRTSILEVILR
ncbi:unnamed protein product, partial [Closterium sp. NIES-54]